MTEPARGRSLRLRLTRSALTLLWLAPPVGVAWAKGPQGENVHRPDAVCLTCHTTDRDALESDRAAARTQIAPDVENRCGVCHNEGPSHRTGMPPKAPVPETLRLSPDGLITCATCHYAHGEQNPHNDFLRIDNSRGALCLTCHQLSELQ
ncbi:MAG TPA: cytochrome c3 family protein [Candidatus Binatia bacterium]|nr:cytochrome c3 family protein [Candidatus Binatia bacterium]